MGNSIPDEGPITTLYQEMYGRMIAYASSVLGDRSLAEEAVQDTFCIFCVKAETTLRYENPQGWLMRTLQNVMRNMQRHRAAASRLIMQSLQTERLEELLVYDEEDVELLYGDLAAHADFQLGCAGRLHHAGGRPGAGDHGGGLQEAYPAAACPFETETL